MAAKGQTPFRSVESESKKGTPDMRNNLLDLVEKSSLREKPLQFAVGDTVDVHTRILEGTKERIQIFSGVVIARSGSGTGELFTVRRIVQGEGVERKFPVNSPKISHIEVKRHARVRRAKLFYLRERTGKATRLKERKAKPWEVQVSDSGK
jgi:large subunit ribosomal protein L19